MSRVAFSHGEEEYEKRSIREHLVHQRTMRLMLSDDWKCVIGLASFYKCRQAMNLRHTFPIELKLS
jgi:hypothetical protein